MKKHTFTATPRLVFGQTPGLVAWPTGCKTDPHALLLRRPLPSPHSLPHCRRAAARTSLLLQLWSGRIDATSFLEMVWGFLREGVGKSFLTVTKPEVTARSSQDKGRAPRAGFFFHPGLGPLAWCPLEPFCPRQHKSCGLSSCPGPQQEMSLWLPYSGRLRASQASGVQGIPRLLRFVRWSWGRSRCVSACVTLGVMHGGEGN